MQLGHLCSRVGAQPHPGDEWLPKGRRVRCRSKTTTNCGEAGIGSDASTTSGYAADLQTLPCLRRRRPKIMTSHVLAMISRSNGIDQLRR